MLIPTPIVAIDDDSDHTDLLASGLAYGGAGLIPLLWAGKLYFKSGAISLEFNTKLSGVRIVFCDFHLEKAKVLSDKRVHHNTIATVLDDIIGPDNGPFVLVIWTRFPDNIAGLGDYIVENNQKYCRPVAIIPLPKEPYLARKPEECAAQLSTDITGRLKENGTTGLWFWERVVMTAAARTVTSITSLADEAKGEGETGKIEDLLWRLAVAAAGEKHVPSRPAYALNEALAPILYDRLTSLAGRDDEAEHRYWETALGLPRDPAVSVDLKPPAVAKINTALHIAKDGEAGRSSDRGAVVTLMSVIEIEAWTGVGCASIRDFISSRLKFEVTDDTSRDFRVIAVQIQASCDFAQINDGLIPYVIGVEAPEKVRFIHADGKPNKQRPGYYYCSPSFMIDGKIKHIYLNPRFLISLRRDIALSKRGAYRLREALVNDASTTIYEYGSRPGIVSIREKI